MWNRGTAAATTKPRGWRSGRGADECGVEFSAPEIDLPAPVPAPGDSPSPSPRAPVQPQPRAVPASPTIPTSSPSRAIPTGQRLGLQDGSFPSSPISEEFSGGGAFGVGGGQRFGNPPVAFNGRGGDFDLPSGNASGRGLGAESNSSDSAVFIPELRRETQHWTRVFEGYENHTLEKFYVLFCQSARGTTSLVAILVTVLIIAELIVRWWRFDWGSSLIDAQGSTALGVFVANRVVGMILLTLLAFLNWKKCIQPYRKEIRGFGFHSCTFYESDLSTAILSERIGAAIATVFVFQHLANPFTAQLCIVDAENRMGYTSSRSFNFCAEQIPNTITLAQLVITFVVKLRLRYSLPLTILVSITPYFLSSLTDVETEATLTTKLIVIFLVSFTICGLLIVQEQFSRTRFEAAVRLRASSEVEETQYGAVVDMLRMVTPSLEQLTKNLPIFDQNEDCVLFGFRIQNFTKWSTTLLSNQIVAVIESLFSQFDLVASSTRVEKLQTSGDVYLVCNRLRFDPEEEFRQSSSFEERRGRGTHFNASLSQRGGTSGSTHLASSRGFLTNSATTGGSVGRDRGREGAAAVVLNSNAACASFVPANNRSRKPADSVVDFAQGVFHRATRITQLLRSQAFGCTYILHSGPTYGALLGTQTLHYTVIGEGVAQTLQLLRLQIPTSPICVTTAARIRSSCPAEMFAPLSVDYDKALEELGFTKLQIGLQMLLTDKRRVADMASNAPRQGPGARNTTNSANNSESELILLSRDPRTVRLAVSAAGNAAAGTETAGSGRWNPNLAPEQMGGFRTAVSRRPSPQAPCPPMSIPSRSPPPAAVLPASLNPSSEELSSMQISAASPQQQPMRANLGPVQPELQSPHQGPNPVNIDRLRLNYLLRKLDRHTAATANAASFGAAGKSASGSASGSALENSNSPGSSSLLHSHTVTTSTSSRKGATLEGGATSQQGQPQKPSLAKEALAAIALSSGDPLLTTMDPTQFATTKYLRFFTTYANPALERLYLQFLHETYAISAPLSGSMCTTLLGLVPVICGGFRPTATVLILVAIFTSATRFMLCAIRALFRVRDAGCENPAPKSTRGPVFSWQRGAGGLRSDQQLSVTSRASSTTGDRSGHHSARSSELKTKLVSLLRRVDRVQGLIVLPLSILLLYGANSLLNSVINGVSLYYAYALLFAVFTDLLPFPVVVIITSALSVVWTGYGLLGYRYGLEPVQLVFAIVASIGITSALQLLEEERRHHFESILLADSSKEAIARRIHLYRCLLEMLVPAPLLPAIMRKIESDPNTNRFSSQYIQFLGEICFVGIRIDHFDAPHMGVDLDGNTSTRLQSSQLSLAPAPSPHPRTPTAVGAAGYHPGLSTTSQTSLLGLDYSLNNNHRTEGEGRPMSEPASDALPSFPSLADGTNSPHHPFHQHDQTSVIRHMEKYYAVIENALQQSSGLLYHVGTLGDVFSIAGPIRAKSAWEGSMSGFQSSRKDDGGVYPLHATMTMAGASVFLQLDDAEYAVLTAAREAMLLMLAVQKALGRKVSSIGTCESAYAAVVGLTRPQFDIIGSASRTVEAALGAAPNGFCGVTAKFRKVLSFSPAGEELSRTRLQEADSWATPTTGIMRVHPLRPEAPLPPVFPSGPRGLVPQEVRMGNNSKGTLSASAFHGGSGPPPPATAATEAMTSARLSLLSFNQININSATPNSAGDSGSGTAAHTPNRARGVSSMELVDAAFADTELEESHTSQS
jgi:hypothetical protein